MTLDYRLFFNLITETKNKKKSMNKQVLGTFIPNEIFFETRPYTVESSRRLGAVNPSQKTPVYIK